MHTHKGKMFYIKACIQTENKHRTGFTETAKGMQQFIILLRQPQNSSVLNPSSTEILNSFKLLQMF